MTTDADRAARLAALQERRGGTPRPPTGRPRRRALDSRIAVAGAATGAMLALTGVIARAATNGDAQDAADPAPMPAPEQTAVLYRQVVHIYRPAPPAGAPTVIEQVAPAQVAATPAPRVISATPRQVTVTKSSGSR